MITNVPNWQTKTAQEILDYLNESVWVPNNQAVTVAVITAAVGLEAGALVVGTIDAASGSNPLLKASFTALSTTGMQLSSPDRQGLIDSLAVAGSWPNSVRDAVKALGGIYQPRWQQYGDQPTLESITAEIAETQQQETLAQIRARLDVAFNQIGTAEQSQAITELRLIADELDA